MSRLTWAQQAELDAIMDDLQEETYNALPEEEKNRIKPKDMNLRKLYAILTLAYGQKDLVEFEVRTRSRAQHQIEINGGPSCEVIESKLDELTGWWLTRVLIPTAEGYVFVSSHLSKDAKMTVYRRIGSIY